MFTESIKINLLLTVLFCNGLLSSEGDLVNELGIIYAVGYIFEINIFLNVKYAFGLIFVLYF